MEDDLKTIMQPKTIKSKNNGCGTAPGNLVTVNSPNPILLLLLTINNYISDIEIKTVLLLQINYLYFLTFSA